MYDPTEEQLVEQAARDALFTINSMNASEQKIDIAAVSKFVKSGNRMIRVRVSVVENPPCRSSDSQQQLADEDAAETDRLRDRYFCWGKQNRRSSEHKP